MTLEFFVLRHIFRKYLCNRNFLEKYNAENLQDFAQTQLDFYKIYNAITYKYPRAKGLASPGFAAGSCLFKDTMQLAAYSNNNFFLGHAAMLGFEILQNIFLILIYLTTKLKYFLFVTLLK